MDCNTCKEKRDMVSRYNFQSTVSTLERANRRLWIIILVLIIALVGSNAGWIAYEAQFTDEEATITQEVDTGNGDANVTGIGIGDYYGEDKANN